MFEYGGGGVRKTIKGLSINSKRKSRDDYSEVIRCNFMKKPYFCQHSDYNTGNSSQEVSKGIIRASSNRSYGCSASSRSRYDLYSILKPYQDKYLKGWDLLLYYREINHLQIRKIDELEKYLMIKERSLQQYKRMLRKNSQKLSELMSTYEMIIFRLREGRMYKYVSEEKEIGYTYGKKEFGIVGNINNEGLYDDNAKYFNVCVLSKGIDYKDNQEEIVKEYDKMINLSEKQFELRIVKVLNYNWYGCGYVLETDSVVSNNLIEANFYWGKLLDLNDQLRYRVHELQRELEHRIGADNKGRYCYMILNDTELRNVLYTEQVMTMAHEDKKYIVGSNKMRLIESVSGYSIYSSKMQSAQYYQSWYHNYPKQKYNILYGQYIHNASHYYFPIYNMLDKSLSSISGIKPYYRSSGSEIGRYSLKFMLEQSVIKSSNSYRVMQDLYIVELREYNNKLIEYIGRWKAKCSVYNYKRSSETYEVTSAGKDKHGEHVHFNLQDKNTNQYVTYTDPINEGKDEKMLVRYSSEALKLKKYKHMLNDHELLIHELQNRIAQYVYFKKSYQRKFYEASQDVNRLEEQIAEIQGKGRIKAKSKRIDSNTSYDNHIILNVIPPTSRYSKNVYKESVSCQVYVEDEGYIDYKKVLKEVIDYLQSKMLNEQYRDTIWLKVMQNITINNILVAITTTLDSYIHKLRDELRVELTVYMAVYNHKNEEMMDILYAYNNNFKRYVSILSGQIDGLINSSEQYRIKLEYTQLDLEYTLSKLEQTRVYLLALQAGTIMGPSVDKKREYTKNNRTLHAQIWGNDLQANPNPLTPTRKTMLDNKDINFTDFYYRKYFNNLYDNRDTYVIKLREYLSKLLVENNKYYKKLHCKKKIIYR